MDRTPTPSDDRGDDPALRPVRLLVEEHLAMPSSTWTAGAPGAVARFARDGDERAQRGPNSVVTPRGGLRVLLPDDAVAVAYETPSRRDPLRWHQVVAFCVPDDDARRAARTAITELGPDADALRPQDTAGVLFDLGLGVTAADVLVRTSDVAALAVLRAAEGREPLDPDLDLAAVLSTITTHAVVLTVSGRLEVLGSDRRPGAGPHLRLQLGRARAGVDPPPHVPIPAGWTPVLRLYPAHPAQEPDGRPIPFEPARYQAFQDLLAEYGDPVLGVVAVQVADAVRAGRGPETTPLADDQVTRAAVGVALRRLAVTDGTSGTLAAWRSRWGPAPDLVDTDED